MSEPLLSPEFLRQLDQREFASKRVLAGRLKGERRSKRRGVSIEFADHRGYVSGDDLRFIDWNILIRLDHLFIKLFEEEEDLRLYFLIDASESMGFGEPTKLRTAAKMAAALAFVGLTNLDHVQLMAFGGTTPPAPPFRGRAAVWRALDWLNNLQPAGSGDFERAARGLLGRNPIKGVLVVLSDFLDKRGYEGGLRLLTAAGFDVLVTQIFAAEELEPELTGDLRLLDSEDDDAAEVTVSAPLLERYKANVRGFRAGLREYCLRRGAGCLFIDNQTSVEDLVLTELRQLGILK